MEGYERIHPGAAAMIIGMAERGHSAAIRREDDAARRVFIVDMTGRYLGFTFAAVGLIGGIFLVYNGYPGAGGTIATTSITGTVIGLITGGRSSKKVSKKADQDKGKAPS